MTKKEKTKQDLEREAARREVYDLRVLVIGGGYAYLKMFFDAGFRGAKNVQDADIICFTGGEDVDPGLYGEEMMPETYCNPARDAKEAGLYADALLRKKPMIGICRGAQFLNVMNGGKLWQDVNNHGISGGHDIIDMSTGETVSGMTSTHHQQMRSGKDAEVLAVAQLSTYKSCQDKTIRRDTPELDDEEVLWYENSLCLCFQPHPEYNEDECRNYFFGLVDEYILPAT